MRSQLLSKQYEFNVCYCASERKDVASIRVSACLGSYSSEFLCKKETVFRSLKLKKNKSSLNSELHKYRKLGETKLYIIT